MEILRVENICKTYEMDNAPVHALSDVSFSVDKGEFVAIIGASGSGKSTLLHILGGVDRPTSGKVFVDGQDVYEQNEDELAVFRRRQVGLVYQFYNLIPVLTVEENITLPIRLDGRKINQERLKELLSTLKLVKRRKHLPSQLSGGQQQRVAIGRALINAPAIILADEPTGNLDPETAKDIMRLIMDINKAGTTVLMATHAKDIVDSSKRRVIALEKGRIVRDEKKGRYEFNAEV